MRRHCLSRPTWRPRRGRAQQLGPSRYASIRTLGELTFFWWLGAYDEIRLDSGYQGGAAIFRSVSPPPKRVDQVRMAQSHPQDPKRWTTRSRFAHRFTTDAVPA